MELEGENAEFKAYEQGMQLIKVGEYKSDNSLLNDTGLTLDIDADGSILHPSFRFKQLENDTNLNFTPTEKEREDHIDYLMKNSQHQMALKLHQGRVELAGCGNEYHNISKDETTDDPIHFLGPAENIKTLFKLPYSKNRISLAIHRIGNTLVIDGDVDEKDLPKGFDAWNEILQLNSSHDNTYTSSTHLYENFIYQSTQLPPTNESIEEIRMEQQQSTEKIKKKDSKLQNHHENHAPNVIPAFQRTFKWKFHDMKMILGSDVQLFSNKEHPSVSLKLHDIDQDMSLCTALDYYLDNVIANIPELAICMHAKGYVRGYQLIQTRDIPYLNGAATPLFDIQDVNLNATMLFRFLQQNCSESNGTYWLYREEGSCSLRLYDIRMLSHGKQRKWKYMMAMLCYRFASRAGRLIVSTRESPTLQSRLRIRQRELLTTCLELMEEIRQDERRSKAQDSICATVAEQMADTYLFEKKIENLLKAKKYLNQNPSLHTEFYFILMKKLGNVSNELGKFYLNENKLIESYLWFQGGSILFEAIDDGGNVGLLYANLANLHKVMAKNEIKKAEYHYEKAIEWCMKAQNQLNQFQPRKELYRKINGELGLTYLVWAVHSSQYDTTPSIVLEKFNKALNIYIEIGDQRQIAATHYQMATYYSQYLLNSNRKKRMEVARRHYEKALDYFGSIEIGKTFVIIHYELAQLYASSNKIQDIEHAILIILNMYDVYKNIENLLSIEKNSLIELAPSILNELKKYLMFIIRYGTRKSIKLDMFKEMYREMIYKEEEPFGMILDALRRIYH